MAKQEPRYRYRFFLQNSGKMEQTVLTIKPNGDVFLKEVPKLSIITAKDLESRDTPANTLAYFDHKTTQEQSLASFLDGFGVPIHQYSLNKTHIGYFYCQRIRRMKPVLDNPTLYRIASNSLFNLKNNSGYVIMPQDPDAKEFKEDLFERLANKDSDYISILTQVAAASNGFQSFEYSIPPRLINLLQEYRREARIQRTSDHFSSALAQDMDDCRSDIEGMLYYYHNLRDMIRFTQDFDNDRDKLDNLLVTTQERREAAKQKRIGSYPGQYTLFDYMKGNKE